MGFVIRLKPMQRAQSEVLMHMAGSLGLWENPRLKGLSLKLELSSKMSCFRFAFGQCGELGRVHTKVLVWTGRILPRTLHM